MIRFLVVIGVLLFVSPAQTQALSCAPPKFDAQAIERLGIIFEGLVEHKQPPSLWARVKSQFSKSSVSNASTYTFLITQLWKGESVEGERVTIIAPPGWGQQTAYEVGKNYLVFGATEEKPGVYLANPHWCGFDMLPKEQVMMVLELMNE